MERQLETLLVHAGEEHPRPAGAMVLPIYQSSTFEWNGEEDYHDIRYSRLSNTPNHHVLHRKLAALEGAESGLVTASGMAAISAALLSNLGAGDHLLVQRGVYGGTHDFIVHDLPRLGIEHDFIDATAPESWRALLRPTTRLIYVETITNPLLEVAELEAVNAFAREHDLVSVVDNTFATPVNFRAAAAGFDLSVHSATKYLNGHSDLIAGALIGRSDLVESAQQMLNHLGGSLDPHACFLLHRGLRTLALRVRQQSASAEAVARMLSSRDDVERVFYPALASHPTHRAAARLLTGFGGMLAFEPAGGVNRAAEFMGRLELATEAPSLGGPETLVSRPVTMSHVGMSLEARQAAGISEHMVRVSIGLEGTDDLVADFAAALDRG